MRAILPVFCSVVPQRQQMVDAPGVQQELGFHRQPHTQLISITSIGARFVIPECCWISTLAFLPHLLGVIHGPSGDFPQQADFVFIECFVSCRGYLGLGLAQIIICTCSGRPSCPGSPIRVYRVLNVLGVDG